MRRVVNPGDEIEALADMVLVRPDPEKEEA
jgi:hypothetical protein